MKKSLLYLTVFLIYGCGPNINYTLRNDAKIENLSLCIHYSVAVNDSIKSSYDRRFKNYINDYNQQVHPFKISICNDSTRSALNIYVPETQFVRGGGHIGGTVLWSAFVALDVLILSSPMALISPFVFYIPYFLSPRTTTVVRTRLSEDLATVDTTLVTPILSNGFLVSKRRQIKKNSREFKNILWENLTEIEFEYKKIKEK